MAQQSTDQTYKLKIYHAVRALKQEQNLSDDDVVAYFAKQGVKQEAALGNLRLYYDVERQRIGANARRDIMFGALIVVAGFALLVVHQPLAESHIVVRAFMPVAGGTMLIYGLYRRVQAIRLPNV